MAKRKEVAADRSRAWRWGASSRRPRKTQCRKWREWRGTEFSSPLRGGILSAALPGISAEHAGAHPQHGVGDAGAIRWGDASGIELSFRSVAGAGRIVSRRVHHRG